MTVSKEFTKPEQRAEAPLTLGETAKKSIDRLQAFAQMRPDDVKLRKVSQTDAAVINAIASGEKPAITLPPTMDQYSADKWNYLLGGLKKKVLGTEAKSSADQEKLEYTWNQMQ